MELLIIVAVWAVMGYAGYNVAKSKHRDPTLWAVLCTAFGFIPLIILACLPTVVIDYDKECENAIREMKV